MSKAAVEWEIFQDAMKEAEDAFDMLETDAHGVRHRERSIAVKQAIATAFHQAKAVENAIPEMRQQEERAVWKRKLLAGRKEVKEIERRADQIDGISAKKEKLFHGAEEEGGASSSDPRARVEKTSTMLHGQNKSLSRSEQIGLETERIGHETLNTLHGNRETMHHAIERTEDLRVETTRARATITNIKRVIVWGKLMQIIIISVLLLAILLVVYFRWLHHKSSSPPPAPPAPVATPIPSPTA